MSGPTHYRYDTTWHGTHVEPFLTTFDVLQETPRGYWVIESYQAMWPAEIQEKKRRWVSKDSRKRYCYPSKEQAWESFKIRCQWRVTHLERQLEVAKAAAQLSTPEDTQRTFSHIERSLLR